MTTERIVTDDDGTEIVVRPGVVFKAGYVVICVYDKDGFGATGYVTPAHARELAHDLIISAHEADKA